MIDNLTNQALDFLGFEREETYYQAKLKAAIENVKAQISGNTDYSKFATDYTKLADALYHLGESAQQLLNETRNKKIKQLKIENLFNADSINLTELKDTFFDSTLSSLSYYIFQEAWWQIDLNISEEESAGASFELKETLKQKKKNNRGERRLHLYKKELRKSSRQKISLGLRVIEMLSPKKLNDVKYNLEHEGVEEKLKLAMIAADEDAVKAIVSYQTNLQKFLTGLGWIIAGLFSVGTGVTTVAAIVSSFPVSVPLLIIAAVIGIGTVVGVWRVFKIAIPGVLIDMAGKDHWLEGLTNYLTPEGEKEELTTGRKWALALSISLAISAGIATAAITFSSIMALATTTVPLLAFLTVGIGVTLLPYVAGFLALVTLICIIGLTIKAFATILKTESFREAFFKPFDDIAKIFDATLEHNQEPTKSAFRLNLEKVITYGLTILLTGLGIAALGLMSFVTAQPIGSFLTAYFGVLPQIAIGIGYGVSMGLSFLAQLPFTIQSMAKSIEMAANYFSQKFSPSSDTKHESQNPDIISDQDQVPQAKKHQDQVQKIKDLIDISSQKSWGEKIKDKIITVFEGILYFINAAGSSALVMNTTQTSLSLPLTLTATGGNFSSTLSATIASNAPPANALPPEEEKTHSAKRILRALKHVVTLQNENEERFDYGTPLQKKMRGKPKNKGKSSNDSSIINSASSSYGI